MKPSDKKFGEMLIHAAALLSNKTEDYTQDELTEFKMAVVENLAVLRVDAEKDTPLLLTLKRGLW